MKGQRTAIVLGAGASYCYQGGAAGVPTQADIIGRTAARVCPNHRRVCEALEPGDWILDFNWDSVMADTLLYHSHFWFPVDGFGVPVQVRLLPPVQKSLAVESLVKLFHLHGSVVLFESTGADSEAMYLYLGPKQYSFGTGLVAITGIDPKPGSSVTTRTPEMGQIERLMRGDVFIHGKWFSPIFIPPSKHKVAHPHPYVLRLRKQIHARLPSVQRIIVAGYSFPEVDTEHLTRLFIPDILSGSLELQVINRENSSDDFRARVRRVFGELADRADFTVDDFREYCRSLPAPIGETSDHPMSSEE